MADATDKKEVPERGKGLTEKKEASIAGRSARKKKEREPSLAFGGQALIEGILIRSKNYSVVCVRREDGGIEKMVEKLDLPTNRHRVLRYPFIRGIVALFETMYIGVKALFQSADVNLDEEEKIKPRDIAITVAMAILLAVGLFIVLPFFVTQYMQFRGFWFNLFEGFFRLGIFLLYLVVLSLSKDIRRVLQYHGAEHTAINLTESGKELTPENLKDELRFHPRCGTSFLFIVLLLSIFLFSILPDYGWLINLSYRFALIPVIASLSYEMLKFSDGYRDSSVVKGLSAPGLLLQRLTTRPPTSDMVEVAFEAVKEAQRLERES